MQITSLRFTLIIENIFDSEKFHKFIIQWAIAHSTYLLIFYTVLKIWITEKVSKQNIKFYSCRALKLASNSHLIGWYSHSHNDDFDGTDSFGFRVALVNFFLFQIRRDQVPCINWFCFDFIFLPTLWTSTATATTLIAERSYWCSRRSETCS